MLPPIVCHSCGMPLGDVAAIFKAMCLKKIKEHLKTHNIHPDMYTMTAANKIKSGTELDKLMIINECCRTQILTNMEFKDYY
jgi:DNA-directed RNA polymerase subunit N (RpoN/RPB10)